MIKWGDRANLSMLGKGLIGLAGILILGFLDLFNLRGGKENIFDDFSPKAIWINDILLSISYMDSTDFCKEYNGYFNDNEVGNFYNLYKGKLNSTFSITKCEDKPLFVCFKVYHVSSKDSIIQILEKDSLISEFYLLEDSSSLSYR